ncbi:hypothetical protein GGTG_09184 [Gaeumannomyces tritici R3-111a-1]|uniref:Ecp2 effector protein domain-containing protein n=1 Tax=Gaeumannomyces tritici (strain R3-111a-1) TaxID=644352 RepID=J3P6P2_GAET3|nr:hypothetical protein GGTG_09184 [Gaeumannomyces tritici R3-111a-1]EJT72318.1 hypothetical protein GGTG_09184 [Gaeumannomyces tritici R3-111a-1]
MLFPTALLVSSLTLATAFKVPEGQANGVYRAYYNAEGKEVHEPLTADMLVMSEPEGETTILQAPTVAPVTPRQAGNPLLSKRRDNIYCGCGFTLNPGDCDAVVDNLKAQLGGHTWISPRMSYYSIMDRSVVAFVCNLSGRSTLGISANAYADWLGVITDECGRYIAGSEGTPGSSALGYMRVTGDFCGDALSSPSHHC